MQLIQCPPLPSDTAHAAKLAFEKEHPYLQIGNQLNSLLIDLQLSKPILDDEILFASFWPIAIMTILQFRENLGDQRADAAIRTRVDLKYALHLPLNFPGFAPLALCQFRQRLANNQDAQFVFLELINRLKELIGNDQQQPEDTNQLLITICNLNRLETMFESMSHAIEALATNYPEWLVGVAQPHWRKRYNDKPCFQPFRGSLSITDELLESIGEDGQHLLSEIDNSGISDIEYLSDIRSLRQEWQSQFDKEHSNLRLRGLICYPRNECLKTNQESIYACSTRNKEVNAILKRKQA